MKYSTSYLAILSSVYLYFSVLQVSGEDGSTSTGATPLPNNTTQVIVQSSSHTNGNHSNDSTTIATTTKPANTTEDHVNEGPTTDKPENVKTDSVISTTTKSPVSMTTATNSTTNSTIVSPSDHVSNNTSDIQTASPDLTTGSDEKSQTGSPTVQTTPGTTAKFVNSWMDYFTRVHHFDGVYEYAGGQYSFDFVIMYVHPVDVFTLVAKLYDQDGAIIELNGTSTNGYHIIFKQSNIYSADFRFTASSGLELDGLLVRTSQSTYYTGNITRPLNSSFTWFHMNKGLGEIITGDASGTRTAIIIVIPASLAFLAVIGTTATLCWASKRGLFGRRHKSYLLFKDNPVSYESEAETIHI